MADVAPPSVVQRSPLARFDAMIAPAVTAFERSASVHLIGYVGAIVSFAAVILGVYQFWGYLEDRNRELAIIEEEREARIRDREIQEEERYERAWDRLLRRDPGDTRNGRALGTLLEAGVKLADLDLRCETIGKWDADANVCVETATLSNFRLNLPASTFALFKEFIENPAGGFHTLPGNDSIMMGDFHDLLITNSDFSGLALDWSYAKTELDVRDSIFTAAIFFSMATPPQILRGDLSFSYWDLADHGPDPLSGTRVSNMTGIVFDVRSNIRARDERDDLPSLFARNQSLQGPDQPSPFRGWAWADRPPMILDAALGRLVPASIYHLHGIEFYDPECRVNHRPGQSPSLEELTNPDLQGIEPKLRPELELSFARNSLVARVHCMVGFWPDAARRFPDRYPVVPDGYDYRWDFTRN